MEPKKIPSSDLSGKRTKIKYYVFEKTVLSQKLERIATAYLLDVAIEALMLEVPLYRLIEWPLYILPTFSKIM